ncbi:hypothetical protein ACJRO7_027933 [Eucalyptus globulus]|uniref:Uncharacterized protein n=1 Tax=Eucalyptus globulus TaxID=34317 RepID=A0ABD3JTM6_EUCGL
MVRLERRVFYGYVADEVGSVGADVHRAQLLCEGVREYEGMGAERDVGEKKPSMRIVKVQGESMVHMVKIAEVKTEELDERISCKYGQRMRTNFEG